MVRYNLKEPWEHNELVQEKFEGGIDVNSMAIENPWNDIMTDRSGQKVIIESITDDMGIGLLDNKPFRWYKKYDPYYEVYLFYADKDYPNENDVIRG